LVLVPECPFWPVVLKPRCGPAMAVGEWCEGDRSCGTDDEKNDCFFWEEIYLRVDCALTPPSPPPPLPPLPPASPGESSMFPAPPPPVDLSGLALSQETRSTGVIGPITLQWLIVIITLCVCFPLLLVALFFYLFPGYYCLCCGGGAKEPQPVATSPVDFGGTVFYDEDPNVRLSGV